MTSASRRHLCGIRTALIVATVALATGNAEGQAPPPPAGQSFAELAPGFTQQLIGSVAAPLGQGVMLSNGDMLVAECRFRGGRLHRFTPTATRTPFNTATVVWNNTSVASNTGCGLALHPDGFLYSSIDENTSSGKGLVRLDPVTGATHARFGNPANALGIAIDPQDGRIFYGGRDCIGGDTNSCTIYAATPSSQSVEQFIRFKASKDDDNSGPGSGPAPPAPTRIDGLSFEPTGNFLFVAVREPFSGILILDRARQVVQTIVTASRPSGIAFSEVTPGFVLTNNVDQTMTRLDFPGGDFRLPPQEQPFASGGFPGVLGNVGADSCFYATQVGTRWDNNQTSTQNSIVRICSGFAQVPAPPPPPASSICGFVFNDANNDGVKDAGEAGIAGVDIALTGIDYLRHGVTRSAATDGDGAYCFEGLNRGTYTVTEGHVAEYLDGKDVQGLPGTATAGNDTFTNIELGDGVSGQGNNFGEVAASSVCGFVYMDANGNGIRDGGEAGIVNVLVALAGTDDLGASVALDVTTGADGGYCAANLRPGTYSLAETQPRGFLDGVDVQGSPGTGSTGNDVFTGITFAPGTAGTDNNFGELAGSPALTLTMLTNGVRHAQPPGPIVGPGTTVSFQYLVTNSGDVDIDALAVTDDVAGVVACPAATLAPGAGMTCTASVAALVGGVASTATVTGITAGGQSVSASDRGHYVGGTPSVGIKVLTNGTDHSAPPGVVLAPGAPITWSYVVTNTGNIELTDIVVTDDRTGTVACPVATLAAAATMTCTATGTAATGQYANVGAVTASAAGGLTVTASDSDYYFGGVPSVGLRMLTNGNDRDAAPGTMLAAGTPVTWTYVVRNMGQLELSSVVLRDDRRGAVACPSSTLAVGAEMTCTAAGTAAAGQYSTTAHVTASAGGGSVTAANAEHHFGVASGISIVARTNGGNYNSGTGPTLTAASPVEWSYVVTNAGNVTLSAVAVRDDRLGAIACPSTTLAVGGSFTCIARGTATVGQYVNTATVTATDVLNATVTAQDSDRYIGITRPPICTAARPSVTQLWPPNHKHVPVKVLGVRDPDNDRVTVTVTGVRQIETFRGGSTRNTVADAYFAGDTAWIRSERAGQSTGRSYVIAFDARDDKGGSCSGTVTIGVPHDQGNGSGDHDENSCGDSSHGHKKRGKK